MNFAPCPLEGAVVIDIAPARDERGFFARTFCAREFAARGLAADLRQCSVSFNARRGTLRGLHFQAAPHEEDKLVRCTAGAVFDVIVDLRPGSATRHDWFGLELSAANRRALYVPRGFAHGFLSLAPDTELLYMISADYVPDAARGVRWNDPAIGIAWPAAPAVISARDAAYPLLGAGAVDPTAAG
jgi:dTDP-4-dehydrorhamnose 3,5-epimerase